MTEKVKTETEGYLEKPFSMDDPARMLEGIAASEAKAAGGRPTASTAPAPWVTAYALVGIDPSADPLKAYRKLYFLDSAISCDAIGGEHDLIMLLHGATQEDIASNAKEQIETVEGVVAVTILPVDKPVFEEDAVGTMGSLERDLERENNENEVHWNQISRVAASSYVLLEIEQEKLDTIYPALYFSDQVVYCDCTTGKYDIVMLMKGSSSSHIESTIRNKFKSLDGVLRIEEWPIITLFDL